MGINSTRVNSIWDPGEYIWGDDDRGDDECRGTLKAYCRRLLGMTAARGQARLKIDRAGIVFGDTASASQRRYNAQAAWEQGNRFRREMDGYARGLGSGGFASWGPDGQGGDDD